MESHNKKIQMSENVKLEVAVEIISAKIANLSKNGYSIQDKQMQELIRERNEMYKGNIEIIEKIINKYGPEIKKIYEEV